MKSRVNTLGPSKLERWRFEAVEAGLSGCLLLLGFSLCHFRTFHQELEEFFSPLLVALALAYVSAHSILSKGIKP